MEKVNTSIIKAEAQVIVDNIELPGIPAKEFHPDCKPFENIILDNGVVDKTQKPVDDAVDTGSLKLNNVYIDGNKYDSIASVQSGPK